MAAAVLSNVYALLKHVLTLYRPDVSCRDSGPGRADTDVSQVRSRSAACIESHRTGNGCCVSAGATDASSVLGGEWRRPSRRLLLMRRIELGCTAALLGGLGGGLVAVADGWAGAVVAGSVLVAGLGAEWFVRRRVRAWAYREREDDLLVRRGVLFRRLSVIPYGRMQFIDVTAGPVERSLGLATVRMHTAAAASDARIPGIAAEEAARLRDRLAELGEAKAAGL